jgi:hypothetical protein
MKIEFPRYDDGVKHWSNDVYEREVDSNNHFKTIDDVKKYFNYHNTILTIPICNDIITDIEYASQNKKVAKFLHEELKDFKKEKMNLINQYPFGDTREYWSNQYDLLSQEYLKLILINDTFIKKNKEKIFELLNEQKNMKVNTLKEKRKIADKKYYEKNKAELNIQPRTLLTEDEKKEHKKISDKKYYENKKEELNIQPRTLLTEDEKKEHKKIADKKYYENKKAELNIQPRTLLTEDEKKEHRQISNNKYYEKNKAELNIQPRTLLTEDEKKEHRQISNNKYYEKNKKESVKKPLLTKEQKQKNRQISNNKYYEKKKAESQVSK